MSVRLHLDYDFNSPPDPDGHYHVLAPDFLDVPRAGDEVTFGCRGDDIEARGVVRRVIRICVVERTGDFYAPQEEER